MAKSYLPVDREQPFLLPPDVRDWVPREHLAWFVIDVVERVDTSVLHDRHPNTGVGRRAYDPDMLLAVLVYAYCTGQRSSRQIERLCEVDLAYRVICANHRPDHTTIARFRQDHEEHAVRLFTDVLALCAAAGLASVGTVAVDGTKMGADASSRANRTRESLEAEVRSMFSDAGDVDAGEDALFGADRGDELPAELADPGSRRARLDAALRQLEARRRDGDRSVAQARAERKAALAAAAERGERLRGRPPEWADPVTEAEAALAVAKNRAADRRADIEARAAAEGRPVPGVPSGKGPRVARAEQRLAEAKRRVAEHGDAYSGDEPVDADAEPTRANTTDPDSRTMKTPNGWTQGYNAQAAVNEHGVVLAAEVTQDHNDVHQCQPMMAATQASLDAAGIGDRVELMLFDAGYWSEDNATADGPDRMIAVISSEKQRRATREQDPTTGPPPDDASPREAMRHRLRTEDGARAYAKRSATVETVFGQHKHDKGYRRFTRRGVGAVAAEWTLINAAHNLLKIFTHRPDIVRA